MATYAQQKTSKSPSSAVSLFFGTAKENWGKLLLAVVAFCFWFVFGSGDGKTTPTYTIAYSKTPRSLPFLFAEKKEYFEQAGIKVNLTDGQTPASALESLVSGKLQVAAALPLLPVYASEAKTPGALKTDYFVVGDSGSVNDAILVRHTSMINKPAQLRGKTLGVPVGKANVVFARLVLRGPLGSDTEVQAVELPASGQLQALERRDVQALLVFQPLIQTAGARGRSRVLVENPIEKHVIGPVPLAAAVVSAKFAREQPKAAGTLVKVALKAVEAIREDQAGARHVAAQVLDLDRDASANLSLPVVWTPGDTRRDKADHLQRFADLLHAEGLIESPVDVRAVFLKKTRAAGKRRVDG